MREETTGGRVPPEALTGRTLAGNDEKRTCNVAKLEASSIKDRESYSEYMERNFAYYPKF